MFRAHVPISRRSKLHYTASGIITLKLVKYRDKVTQLFVCLLRELKDLIRLYKGPLPRHT